jgi:hypothetical protein
VDWLQFIASIVGSLASLAWPAIVFALFWLNRNRIANLIAALVKMKLPGGTEFEFRADLADSTLQADRVRVELEAKAFETGSPELGTPDLETRAPVEQDMKPAIENGFEQVERTLDEIRSYIGLPRLATNNRIALTELVNKGLVNHEIISLYESLRSARNAVAHGATPAEEETRLFFRNMFVLHLALTKALRHLKDDGEHSKGHPEG